jgi:hypothetical protein
MRRLRFCLNLVLILAPVGLILLFAGLLMRRVWIYLNSGPRLAGVLSVEATRALGREVRIKSVVFRSNPWSLLPNRVELGGISIAQGVGSASPPLVQADSIVIWYNLRQTLFSRDLQVPLVNEVQLSAPKVAVSRDASGQWNFAQLIKPSTGVSRPFANKISFQRGTVLYSDDDLPHMAGVPRRPLKTTVGDLSGVVLIRAGQSVAFDVEGNGDHALVRDFHVTGTALPKPLRLTTHLTAHGLGFPQIASRLLPPAKGAVVHGSGDVDLMLLYQSEPSATTSAADLNALDYSGTVAFNGVSIASPRIAVPVTNLSGQLTVVADSALGNLAGSFDGMNFDLQGRVIDLRNAFPTPGSKTNVGPRLALRGSLRDGDYSKIVHAINLESALARLDPKPRADIMNAAARGSLNFRVVGPWFDPTAAVSGRLQLARYDRYRGDDIDLRAFYAHRTVDADARGKFAHGNAFVRGHVVADPTGLFQIEAHGRQMHLSALDKITGLRIGGLGNLDFAIQGQRHLTPSISAQAEVSDLTYRNQKLRSVYGYAATVGDPLIVWGRFPPDSSARKKLRLETLRVEDGKGFALGNGTLDLHTQQLALNLEADELDLGAIARTARNGTAQIGGPFSNVPPAGDVHGGDAVSEPNFDLDSLQGVGYLRVHIGGKLKQPTVSGRLNAFAIQAGKAGLDTVTADFSLDRNSLTVNQAVAQRYPGTVKASGHISNLRSRDPKLDLTAELDNVDVADLLDVTGLLPNTDTPARNRSPYVVTGRLFADPISVTGSVRQPILQKPMTVRLESAAVNNLRLPLASAEVTYDSAGLHLLQSRADVAGGNLYATGTVGDRYLDLVISGKGIGLQSLATALPDLATSDIQVQTAPAALAFQPHDIQGTLGFQTRVVGPLHEPRVSGSLTIADLGYRDFVLGTVQARAQFADGRVSVLDAGVTEPQTAQARPGVIRVSNLAYNVNKKTIVGTLQWDNIRLQRLGDLYTSAALADTTLAGQRNPDLDNVAHTLQGVMSGTLQLTGTTAVPTVDLTWNAHDIVVKQQAITSVTGSALLDPHHLVAPAPDHANMPLRIDSPDAKIVANKVDVAYDRAVNGKVEYGDVNADVNAYNVNLTLIRNWLPAKTRKPEPLLDFARQLTGTGDVLGFSVHGKTDSPIIDASANFTNLGYNGFTVDRINLSRATIAEPEIEIQDIELTKTNGDGDPNGPKFIAKVTNGKIGFHWKSPNVADDAPIEIDADVPQQDLNVLSVFGATTSANGKQGIFATDNSGSFEAHAHLSRVKHQWQPVGTLKLMADRLHLESAHTGLRNVAAQLDFKQDTVTASGTAQSYIYDPALPENKRVGDTITLGGSLPVNTPEIPSDTAITLNAPDIKFDENPVPGTASPGVRGSGSLRGDASIRLALKRSFSQPLVQGNIDISNTTFVQPRQFGGAGGGAFALPINPELDLTLNLDKNVRFNSSFLNARIDGAARLTGKLFKKTPEFSVLSGQGSAADDTDITEVTGVPESITNGQSAGEESLLSANNIGLNFRGDFTVRDGRLSLPTARFNLLPPGTQAPGTLAVRYPDFDPSQPGQPVLGYEVNVAAETYLDLPSYNTISGRKRYRVTAIARGRPVIDPVTGQSRLTLNFQTDPPDFSGNQQELQQRIAGVLGGDALQGIGRNPGQVITQQLTSVLSNSVIPGIFDRPAGWLGLDQLALNYDPVQHLNLIVSRRIFGPLYLTYDRSFGGTYEMYNLKASFRFSDRYQLSYDTDDQNTQRVLIEGVWRF